jgi:hypothetical protein
MGHVGSNRRGELKCNSLRFLIIAVIRSRSLWQQPQYLKMAEAWQHRFGQGEGRAAEEERIPISL